MGALSKICNKTGIKQWTSNKKSQMSPETLANTEFTNLKSVHLDQFSRFYNLLYFMSKSPKRPIYNGFRTFKVSLHTFCTHFYFVTINSNTKAFIT